MLMTLKAVSAIEQADLLAFFHAPQTKSRALTTVDAYFDELPQIQGFVLTMGRADEDYREAAEAILPEIDAGQVVAVLCEGDPFTYGSFGKLIRHFPSMTPIDVVPGITSFAASSAAIGRALVQNRSALCVMPATAGEQTLSAAMARTSETLVILKVGPRLPWLREKLAQAGRLAEAWLCVEIGHDSQRLIRLSEAEAIDAPYFSLLIVYGQSPP